MARTVCRPPGRGTRAGHSSAGSGRRISIARGADLSRGGCCAAFGAAAAAKIDSEHAIRRAPLDNSSLAPDTRVADTRQANNMLMIVVAAAAAADEKEEEEEDLAAQQNPHGDDYK